MTYTKALVCIISLALCGVAQAATTCRDLTGKTQVSVDATSVPKGVTASVIDKIPVIQNRTTVPFVLARPFRADEQKGSITSLKQFTTWSGIKKGYYPYMRLTKGAASYFDSGDYDDSLDGKTTVDIPPKWIASDKEKVGKEVMKVNDHGTVKDVPRVPPSDFMTKLGMLALTGGALGEMDREGYWNAPWVLAKNGDVTKTLHLYYFYGSKSGQVVVRITAHPSADLLGMYRKQLCLKE